ncbi:DUF6325 family protein [Microbacterium excoecariae]|uniref:DUF6325 family protein n=1 Tax=Microbacterium excoecariae TaxID=2715210 RepID=UPI00140E6320|nr:DUF6325 family protein [Microbacterium excoecariae]NHI17148.1 hypothetical protein [Microbacterium excoecariae]
MNPFSYGPAEVYLVGFPGAVPDARSFEALGELVSAGTMRVLDLLIITRDPDGSIVIAPAVDPRAVGLGAAEIVAPGLAGDEDIEELAAHVAPGASAAIVVVELTYAIGLATRFREADGELLRTERIPAPVVNALMETLEQEED